MCITDKVPANTTAREDGWKAFRVAATLAFSLVGILAKISAVLAENQIGTFCRFNVCTDYILTKKENFDKAAKALARAGYEIV